MLNEEMLLKKNWIQIKFSPDTVKNRELWNDYLNDLKNMDDSYKNLSLDEWNEKCFENYITDVYVFKDDLNEMFIEQFIEEELYDDFCWKCEVVKEGLGDVYNKDKLYYCDEDYEIINIDYNLSSLIA